MWKLLLDGPFAFTAPKGPNEEQFLASQVFKYRDSVMFFEVISSVKWLYQTL